MASTSVLRQLLDLVLGYDVFVSYAWSDGRDYAKALAVALRKDGYRCFLDDSEMPSGSDLATSVSTALRRSSSLVLVATLDALKSPHVTVEIEAFASTTRPMVPVFLNPELRNFATGRVLSIVAKRVWIDDPAPAPTAATLEKLKQTFKFVRRNRVRMGVLSVATLAFAGVAAFAWWQRGRAEREATHVLIQLRQRENADLLGTGRQREGLSRAVEDIITARRELGGVPVRSTAVLWRAVEAARETRRFHTGYQIIGVAPGADNRSIVAVTRHGEIQQWALDGTMTHSWSATNEQYRAWLLPSGRGVLTYGVPDEGKARISALDGRTLWEENLPPDSDAILADVAASATLLAVSLDRRVVRVFPVGGPPVLQLTFPDGEPAIRDLRLSDNGHRLAVLLADGILRLYETRNPGQPPLAVTMLPDGQLAADQDLKTIVVAKGTSVRVWREGAADPVDFMVPSPPGNAPAGEMKLPAVSGNGRIAFTFTNHPAIFVHEADGRAAFEPLRGGDYPSVAFLRNGTDLIAGDFLQLKIRVFDTGPRAISELVPHGPAGEDGKYEATSALAYCPGRRAVVWGGMEGTLRVLEADGTVGEWRNWHEGFVQSIACTSSRDIVTGNLGGSELKILPGRGFSRTENLSEQEMEKIVPVGDAKMVAGIGGSRIVRVRRLKPFTKVAEFAPGDASGGALGFVRSIAGIPGSNDIIVTGQREAGSGTMFTSRWTLDKQPRLLWKTELPSLYDIWTNTVSPDGETVWVAGPIDRAYALDRNGALRDNLESVLRPGVYSLAYATPDLYAAASFQGEVALMTERERLVTLSGTLPPPVLLAADGSGRRVFMADAMGRIAEIIVNPEALVRIGCGKLESKPAACAPGKK
ncbi:toll/interleukin-1 receptor domain-containing protein [Azospirillum largimobile]